MPLLSGLPIDGARVIYALLDVDSLMNLFATNDRSIQKQLSFPGMFHTLTIPPVDSVRAPLLHRFLRSARHITRLDLQMNARIPVQLLPALTTLNPLELVLGENFLHPSTIGLLNWSECNPGFKPVSRLVADLSNNGFPVLARLTPRLQHVQVSLAFDYSGTHGARVDHLCAIGRMREIQYPPTLTSFYAHDKLTTAPSDWEVLNFVPTGLKHLKAELRLDHSPTATEAIFTRFQSLESLWLQGSSLKVSSARLPLTLTSLTLPKLGSFPSLLLCDSNIKQLPLVSFTMECSFVYSQKHKNQRPLVAHPFYVQSNQNGQNGTMAIDFDQILPETLNYLKLTLNQEDNPVNRVLWAPWKLPCSLTEIDLSIGSARGARGIFDNIDQIKDLTKLTIDFASPFVAIPCVERFPTVNQKVPQDLSLDCCTVLNLNKLPPSVRSLTITPRSLLVPEMPRAVCSQERLGMPFTRRR